MSDIIHEEEREQSTRTIFTQEKDAESEVVNGDVILT